MNRKTEVLIGIGLLVLIIGFIGFNILNNGINKDKILVDIEKAIIEEDVDFLKNHIEMVDGEKLDDLAIKDIIISLKNNNVVLRDLLFQEEDMGNEVIPIKLVQDGKFKLIFNNYKLILEYYDLFINTNIIPLEPEIFINNDKQENLIYSEDIIAIQNIKPGQQEITIKYKENEKETVLEENILVTVPIEPPHIEEDLHRQLNNYGKNIPYFIDLYEDFRMVDIYVDFPLDIAKVFLVINGEKTDIVINDEPASIGPVFSYEDFFVKGVTEIDGEVYETNESNISDFYYESYELYLDYEPPIEVSEEEVREVLKTYLIDLTEAINNNDFSYVSHIIDSNSPLYNMQKDLVTRLSEKGVQEKLLQFQMKDLINIDNDKYQVKVLERHDIIDDGEYEEVENAWLYTLISKNGELYMYNLEKTNF